MSLQILLILQIVMSGKTGFDNISRILFQINYNNLLPTAGCLALAEINIVIYVCISFYIVNLTNG